MKILSVLYSDLQSVEISAGTLIESCVKVVSKYLCWMNIYLFRRVAGKMNVVLLELA